MPILNQTEGTFVPKRFKPKFLITIDTEGDNLWQVSTGAPTTRNSAFLWRFQDLCDEFELKPTYLTNYEMARCPEFTRLGLDVIRRKTGEIGMHLHAWNSPPRTPLTVSDDLHKPFLIEYPERVMRDKIELMTALLKDTFGIQPLSHRAGRWAFDERYARILIENGYVVDCSVTPGVSWAGHESTTPGTRGSDYTSFPGSPYWIDPTNIAKEGGSDLLEVPVTIVQRRRWPRGCLPPILERAPLLQRALNAFLPYQRWLRPNGRNLKDMLDLIDIITTEARPHAEFMLHSSELMPGGSPRFKSKADIERLFQHLRILFSHVSGRFEPATLLEFHNQWQASH